MTKQDKHKPFEKDSIEELKAMQYEYPKGFEVYFKKLPSSPNYMSYSGEYAGRYIIEYYLDAMRIISFSDKLTFLGQLSDCFDWFLQKNNLHITKEGLPIKRNASDYGC